MIIYRVKSTVVAEKAAAWEQYFREKHINDLLNTGFFTGFVFSKMTENNENETVFLVDYYAPNAESIEQYAATAAPALQADVKAHFEGFFRSERSILTLLDKK